MWASDSVRDIDPAELVAAGALFAARYVGTAHQRYGTSRAYIDDCHAAGIGVLLIFEEWGSQFLGGRDAALASCDRMMTAWDRLGAPRDGSTVPAVVLVDPTPGIVLGNEQALRDYAAAWDEALPFPEWTGYGSRYGLELAAGVAGRMTRLWGVRTWGYQTGGDPDMVQEPDLAAPLTVPADYNTLYRPDMGQWLPGINYNGDTPAPAARGADMERLVKNSDVPDGEGWWYFPPVGRAVQVADPLEVIALAQTGIPHFAAPGQSIVAADLRRSDTKKP